MALQFEYVTLHGIRCAAAYLIVSNVQREKMRAGGNIHIAIYADRAARLATLAPVFFTSYGITAEQRADMEAAIVEGMPPEAWAYSYLKSLDPSLPLAAELAAAEDV